MVLPASDAVEMAFVADVACVMMTEGIEVLQKCFSGERFSYSGTLLPVRRRRHQTLKVTGSLMRALSPVMVVCLMAGCAEPLLGLPGGELKGQTAAVPSGWSAIPETIQVETRPSDPYSVNLWAVADGQGLYIATGSDGTSWTGYLVASTLVRARVGDQIYELEATPIDDPAERLRVTAAYSSKYNVDPADGWVVTGMIFRLDPR